MWLGTIVALTAAAGQGRIGGLAIDPSDPDEDVIHDLVVDAVVVEPAIPLGLATVLRESGIDVGGTATIVVSVLDTEDGIPTESSAKIDGRVDGRDFLTWQRNVDDDGRDFLIWQRNVGHAKAARVDDANWSEISAFTDATDKVPSVDDVFFWTPPDDAELYGFDLLQDGKLRGGVVWEISGSEIVTYLWTTPEFVPPADPGSQLTLVGADPISSAAEFQEYLTINLEDSFISSYQTSSEVLIDSIVQK